MAKMSYVVTYTMLIGTSRRETPTAAKALDEILAVKLAGGTNLVILDKNRDAITQAQLEERARAERAN